MAGIIKEALQWIVESQQPKIINDGGWSYTSENLQRLDEELRADPIGMSTLSGLVDYIKSKVDVLDDKMLIHVVSPTEVQLISPLDADRERECLVKVRAELPEITYGRFLKTEPFLISIRANFVQNEGSEAVLRFAGTIESGTLAAYSDDGISQSATVKKGIAGKESALVPNPVKLRPYRTFIEVQQPESEFIFRMRDCNEEIGCAIFEADGGAWKREAMKNIKEYLEFELADLAPQFTVIS